MAKRVCLMQYLRYGETKTKRTDIDISLDDDAMNYYICRQINSTEIKEHFELLTEEGQGLQCLAVIRSLFH